MSASAATLWRNKCPGDFLRDFYTHEADGLVLAVGENAHRAAEGRGVKWKNCLCAAYVGGRGHAALDPLPACPLSQQCYAPAVGDGIDRGG
jgi:hypothetical protein